jgi:hypothetical protein
MKNSLIFTSKIVSINTAVPKNQSKKTVKRINTLPKINLIPGTSNLNNNNNFKPNTLWNIAS